MSEYLLHCKKNASGHSVNLNTFTNHVFYYTWYDLIWNWPKCTVMYHKIMKSHKLKIYFMKNSISNCRILIQITLTSCWCKNLLNILKLILMASLISIFVKDVFVLSEKPLGHVHIYYIVNTFYLLIRKTST